MRLLRIGPAQARQVDDLDANARTVFRCIEQAAEAGVQTMCFPETQTVGYRVDITRTDSLEPLSGDTVTRDEIASVLRTG